MSINPMDHRDPTTDKPCQLMHGRDGKDYTVFAEQWLPWTPEELFPFYGDASNLEVLTPDFLSFQVVTPQPIEMKPGALIDYRLKVHGLPIKWRTRIAKWEPTSHFVDEQIKGPYVKWYHQHRFEPVAGGTRVIDQVNFRPRGGALVYHLFVKRDVEQIFGYRQRVLKEMFGDSAGESPAEYQAKRDARRAAQSPVAA